MRGAALALRQVGYENRAFWRNPAAAFFTFAFPLIFLVIFTTIFGRDAARFFTAGIITLSVVSATFTNIAMSVTLAREEGILAALESSHAIAHALRLAPTMRRDDILLVNLSGRGDKDVLSIQKALDAAGRDTAAT